MFKTKRQRRERRLRKLTDEKWANLPGFLKPYVRLVYSPGLSEEESARQDREEAEAVASITSDPERRKGLIIQWLNRAAADEGIFAIRLDRYLHLLTDPEDQECHDYWSTRRNKIYVLFAFLAFWISVVSLGISIFAAFYE